MRPGGGRGPGHERPMIGRPGMPAPENGSGMGHGPRRIGPGTPPPDRPRGGRMNDDRRPDALDRPDKKRGEDRAAPMDRSRRRDRQGPVPPPPPPPQNDTPDQPEPPRPADPR